LKEGTGAQIPLELLKRRDPILFFDEVVLFESELDDNGISLVSVKLRVMEQRMLLLCRQFMRVDGVVVRVRDTRAYVDFVEDVVVREYTAKEDRFENVTRALMMSGLGPDAVTVAMRDANQIAGLLPVVEQRVESVELAD
jgi:type 2A phosphatase activator TIP41